MAMGSAHLVGILIVLAVMGAVGIYSGKKVSSASDFNAGGGKTGSLLVAGAIMGTLIGGQATVGTVQLAFVYGISAWWFTLGSGIGCFILAVGYVGAMRRSRETTLVGVIAGEYGSKSGYSASVLSSLGIFVSIISQMLASTALLTAILPINHLAAALLSMGLMIVYVIFGGMWGAGIGGVVKLVLLYAASIVGGVLVLQISGGLAGLKETLSGVLIHTDLGALNNVNTPAELTARFGSLFARGPLKDLGSGLSLVLGVLSTQTYASTVWSAKSDGAAKKGALFSAFLIPPIGIACVLIGLFMRGHCITAAEAQALVSAGKSIPEGIFQIATSAQAFPAFILHELPGVFGGVALGALLITVVGSGAGLALGLSTIALNDIAVHLTTWTKESKQALWLSRAVIVVVLVIGALIAVAVPSAVINDFGYLSMGLRGAVIFVPLTTALFFAGRIGGQWSMMALITGPVVVLIGNIAGLTVIDPLFIGVAAGILIMCLGALHRKNHPLEATAEKNR